MNINTSKIPDGFLSTFTLASGHEIHALEGGLADSGETILLIHGAIASRRDLIPTAILLAKHMQVFVPEMPGHGNSSKPTAALSVPEQASVLRKWCAAKNLTRVNVVANSYGCQVAAQLVVDCPDLAATLTLADPSSDPRQKTFAQELCRLCLDGLYEPIKLSFNFC